MYTYRVISESAGAAEMDELHATVIDEPGHIDGGFIAFAESFGHSAAHEQAVGKRCQVLRFDDGEPAGATGGAVRRVAPVEVSLDGGGWT